MDINWMGICITIILSAVAIALGIFFGLYSFRSGVLKELGSIKEKVVVIEKTSLDVWEVIKSKLLFSTGTIKLQLANLGETFVTANPGPDNTVYNVKFEKGKLSASSISNITKDTGFENTEIEYFNAVTQVFSVGERNITVHLPSKDAKLCTEYMSVFLKWLDEVYFNKLQDVIYSFENDIKV